MNKLIYIAGPMRGLPDWNYPTFNVYAEILRTQGWDVINPVDIGNLFGTADYLERTPRTLALVNQIELTCIEYCDAIFLLEGWEKSEGASNELRVALKHHLQVIISKPGRGDE